MTRPSILVLLPLLLATGCYARGGWLHRTSPLDSWTFAAPPANRSVRAMFSWGPSPPQRAGTGRWCSVRFAGLIPDAPYVYDPDADVFLIPLPDGKVLRLRGDPDRPPPVLQPTQDQLDDAEAGWRWALERTPRLEPPRGASE